MFQVQHTAILSSVGLDHAGLDYVEVFLFTEHVMLGSKKLFGSVYCLLCK